MPDNANKPTIKCCCDGSSALNRTGIPIDSNRSRSTHTDLISILSKLWSKLPFVLVREWVKGHQDDLQRPLTVIGLLNCWMDHKAKRIVRQYLASRRRLTFAPTSLGTGTITIDGSLVHTHIQQSLYNHITHRSLVERLSETLEVDMHVLDSTISWSTFSKARKSSPLSLSVFVTKWISNTAATGTVMVARQHRVHNNCPICNAPNEDILHVLTCPHRSASENRDTLLQEFKLWLQSANTSPDITSFLITGLRSWFLDPFGDEPLHETDDASTFVSLLTQLDIGWFALLCGYVTKSLIQCQHSFYKSIESRKHGTSWGRQLSTKLWNLTRSIWMH